MPEAPPATPPAGDPPAPAPITLDTALPDEIGKDNGWRTLRDVIEAHNKASGALANPKAPDTYSLDGTNKFWSDRFAEYKKQNPDAEGSAPVFGADDADIAAFSAAMREAGVSQKQFDRLIPALQNHRFSMQEADAQRWQGEMMQALAPKDAQGKATGDGKAEFEKAAKQAEALGLSETFSMLSPNELANWSRIMELAEISGIKPANPPANPNQPAGGGFPDEFSVKIGEKTYGLDPMNPDSQDAFFATIVGGDKDGKGGTRMSKTPHGQAIEKKLVVAQARLQAEGKLKYENGRLVPVVPV